jgi:RNA polymerase sigma factor (sigma-70 family)
VPDASTSRERAAEKDFADALALARSRLERVLSRFRIPPADGEDLLQDVALSFLRKQDEIIDPTRWLVGALRHECLKYWRTARRRLTETIDEELIELMRDPGPALEDRVAVQAELRGALVALTARCRALLLARYAEGLDERETARKLGYSVASVDKVVRRCVAALAANLASRARLGG